MATKTKLKKPLTWIYPKGIEIQYQRALNNVVRQWEQVAKNTIIPALPSIVDSANAQKKPIASDIKTDDWVDDTNDIVSDYQTLLVGLTPLLPPLIQQTGSNISIFNLRQWRKIVRHSLNIDIFNQEPWLSAHISAFVTENVSLIKKLQDQTTEDIREIITRGVKQGKRHETIAQEILNGTDLQKGVFRKTKTRAKLIARDQVNKLNGQLQQLRQTDIGITRYIWQTSRDERVRSSHRAMDTRSCVWHNSSVYIGSDNKHHSRSGIGGVESHPGQPIQCRCNASPDFSSIKDLDLLI